MPITCLRLSVRLCVCRRLCPCRCLCLCLFCVLSLCLFLSRTTTSLPHINAVPLGVRGRRLAILVDGRGKALVRLPPLIEERPGKNHIHGQIEPAQGGGGGRGGERQDQPPSPHCIPLPASTYFASPSDQKTSNFVTCLTCQTRTHTHTHTHSHLNLPSSLQADLCTTLRTEAIQPRDSTSLANSCDCTLKKIKRKGERG